MEDAEKKRSELCARFVNSTASHVFLTGKAGTGKTTFLRNLAKSTHKNFLIVAPTGIAALNANGVTIHSQFLFPFGSFIPENKPLGAIAEAGQFFTQHTLVRKHPLNSIRNQVLRATELLIIDEVSMLRADVLDAIDFRMRKVKSNFHRSFGGAQVLFIGDLFQLPPIVKDNEWNVLKHYYRSLYFFDAQAIQQSGLVYIELNKVFRQKDDDFLQILNNLRENKVTPEDIAVLNQHYKTEEELDRENDIITLTTHNNKANAINQKRLDQLAGKAHPFKASITGDFPESIYPVAERIELKVGTQVMFIKNDTGGENRYYNGKLAQVVEIDGQDIRVKLAGSDQLLTLSKEEWENKKYSIHPDNKELIEEVIGTFTHYPIKLAWAVTVHKSQGLTFDKAIIDVGHAFAPGQVYVALSRLRSLDGLFLRTQISTTVLPSNAQVVDYTMKQQQQPALKQLLEKEQMAFIHQIIGTSFDFTVIEQLLDYVLANVSTKMEFTIDRLNQVIPKLREQFYDEKVNTQKFTRQLLKLLSQQEIQALGERIQKGSDYYAQHLQKAQKRVVEHLAEVEQLSRTKTYCNYLEELDQQLLHTLKRIQGAQYRVTCILNGKPIEKTQQQHQNNIQQRLDWLTQARIKAKENPLLHKTKSGKKRKTGKKQEKGATYQITYNLINNGKSIEDVAAERGLSVSTINGHVVKGIQSGTVSIKDILPEDQIEEVATELRKSSESLSTVYHDLSEKYTYEQIRMVRASLNR